MGVASAVITSSGLAGAAGVAAAAFVGVLAFADDEDTYFFIADVVELCFFTAADAGFAVSFFSSFSFF